MVNSTVRCSYLPVIAAQCSHLGHQNNNHQMKITIWRQSHQPWTDPKYKTSYKEQTSWTNKLQSTRVQNWQKTQLHFPPWRLLSSQQKMHQGIFNIPSTTFCNLNPIIDTRHSELRQGKTGQNRPPMQRSASISRAVDSPECWWDGKLTDTKVAISDSDRCLLESWVLTLQQDRVTFSFYVTVCQVFTTWACMSRFIQIKPSNWPTHLCIGVWLKVGLTNALSKGLIHLWDCWHSAAALSVVTLTQTTLIYTHPCWNFI